jgi:iron complex outermembrane receptor protein
VERIQAKANGDWARPLGIIHTKEKYNTGQVNVTGKFNTGKLEHAILAGIDVDHYLTQAYNYDVQGKIYHSINILEPSKYVQRTDISVGGFTTIDITAGYSRKRFSLLAKVANLGNV